MHEREEQAFQKAIAPLADTVRQSFVRAMTLRLDVHLALALENGAELEDLDKVIAGAIETSLPISERYFHELAELDKADAITKRKKGST